MQKLRVGGVPEHFNLPIHLCLEEGLFKEVGLDVEWVEFPGGTGAMNEALRNEEIEIAIILTEGIIKDIANGNPSRIIQNYVSSPLIWGVHVAAESNYHSIEDLEDARPAISRYGSGSHVMAFIQAYQLGWDTSKLECVVVNTLDKAIETLQNEKAEYFMWEHFTTKPLVDQGIFRRVADFPTPWSSFVFASTEKAYSQNQQDLSTFLKVVNEKTRNFKSLDHIDEVLATRYYQKPEDIQKWLSLTTWSQSALPRKEMDEAVKHLKSLKMVDDEFNTKNLLTII